MNRCIKVILKKCNEFKPNEISKILSDIQYKTYKACNRAMTYLYTFDQVNNELKEVFDEKLNDKDVLGKSHGAWIENRMNEIMEGCLSNNVAQTRQFVSTRYKNDKKKGLLKGDVNISSFKRDMPIIIHNVAYKIIKTDKGYEAEIGLFNLAWQKEYNIKRFTFLIDKIDNSKKQILNRIMSGEYKKGTAQISKTKKGKWELTISFEFKAEFKDLDPKRTLGIDIGVKNILALAIYDSNVEKHDYVRYSHNLLSGSELKAYKQKLHNEGYSNKEVDKEINKINEERHNKDLRKLNLGVIGGEVLSEYRNTLENKQKSLYVLTKVAGEGRVGHGYKTRTKTVQNVRDKIRNFRDSFNHKYSKYVVDFALKNNCGVIQMEDLTGITKIADEKFLKNWAYYNLQEKIKYKAEQHGIEVVIINPKYTSQRCSKCGNIDKDNRLKQDTFCCTSCNNKINADINAAMNIAIPNIDKIIEEWIS